VKVKTLNLSDKEYPEALRNIYNPPQELFLRGSLLDSDKNAVAIVGTRRATPYGLKQCERFARDLALRGITVISGMALGIDSAAHAGALAVGGRTIAVLGSGHNHIYPRENTKLYGEIIKNGAVVSEYSPDTRPFKTNFPKRNRIISGLSKGVLVVEAPARSGALITADFALQQGREVFALPGDVGSAKSNGTHRLIKEGAKLVECAWDILEDLEHIIDIREEPPVPGSCRPDPAAVLALPEQKKVFAFLDDRPKSLDEISEITNIPVQKVSETLLGLELKKMIKALPGENFVRA